MVRLRNEFENLINRMSMEFQDKMRSIFLINNYDLIQITYLNDFIPLPGTRLATWYTSGSIYYNYTATTDNLVVSYEYGDNEINWQINNSILESETYYVTYKYGALRDSLKNNFGLDNLNNDLVNNLVDNFEVIFLGKLLNILAVN